MKLGIVTYNIAADWDCDTLIETCTRLGLEGAELRTTHAHKVEVELSAPEREAIKKKFADSPVTLVGLGSTFEYHATDTEQLKANVEGSKAYAILARDVGAQGIKVRPNAFPEGVTREQTIEQIGTSLNAVGAFAADLGIKVRLEVHGRGTCDPTVIAQILSIADHPNVYACWNANRADMDAEGSIDANFELLKSKIEICHINEMWSDYPWQRLFDLLKQNAFDGYCLAEIPGSTDPETVLKYYKKLFLAFTGDRP